jgi:hypothetical protein
MDIPQIDERNQRFLGFLAALEVAVGPASETSQDDLEYLGQVFSLLQEREETTLCAVLWSNLMKNHSLLPIVLPHVATSLVKMSAI